MVRGLLSPEDLLACIGDHRQHQAIEASGVFLGLSRRDGGAKQLSNIVRQRAAEDRRMVAAFHDGRAYEAVGSLAARGRLHILVRLWGDDPAPLEDKAIVASTNAQVDAINERCQRLIRGDRPGEGQEVEIRGARAFAGDRVLCRRNAPAFDVCNGDLATVLEADHRRAIRAHSMTRSHSPIPGTIPDVT